jgi:hypothetical protein
MCERAIRLVALALMLSMTGAATAQDWDIEISSVTKPPVIDGQVDAIWSIASVQQIGTRIDGTVTDAADCSGSWRVLWDATFIYVIVDVNDEALFNDSSSAYQDDSVEFYFDGGNSKGPGAPLSEDDRQYTFGWTATDVQGTNTNVTGIEQAQVTTAKGWRIEMRLPWMSLQGKAPALGDFIGIDVFINDDDNGADSREGQVATYGNDSGDWQVPSDWGTAVLVKGSGEKASGPVPADGATDVPRDAVLGWISGEFAAGHNVYFGTNRDDVAAATKADPRGVLVSDGQPAAEYDPEGLLEYGQTYYWRIDEVNGSPDNTAEPFAYPIKTIAATASSSAPSMGPQNTVNGSGLDAEDQHSAVSTEMWMSSGVKPNWIRYEFDKVYKLHELLVWNSNQLLETFMGFGAKDVTIEYSADGQTWAQLEGVPEFARATSQPAYAANTTVPFGGITAKFVKLTINATWGGLPQTGLSEVRFLYVPVHAFEPEPAMGAAGVALEAAMTWRPGREATSHVVYFGDDSDAVAQGTVPAQTVTDRSYTPAAMDFGATYYWRVDEVGDAGTYEGELWSFTSQEYKTIDDFEAYNDDVDAETTIYHAWVDGVTTKASGSQVGYDESPFAETTILHGGQQAMPLAYDNSTSPYYSEAEREFETAQNWTGNGATELCVWTRGYPALTTVAVAETGGKIDLAGSGADIWGTADEFTYAYKTLEGDGSIVARVTNIGPGTNTWAKGGVMIRNGVGNGSPHAMMVMTANTDGAAGNGASFQYRATAGSSSSNSDSTAVVAPPYWVKVERIGSVLRGLTSPDGKAWTQVGTTEVILEDPVLIGLCVTSHQAGEDRTYQFDNITTTGTVTGAWQGAVVDSDKYNAAADMYLIVEDGNGKTATAANATAVTTPDWTAWKIPLSSLTGVNAAKVKKLIIGIGDKTAPTAGGTGIVFIDDIGYGRSAQ